MADSTDISVFGQESFFSEKVSFFGDVELYGALKSPTKLLSLDLYQLNTQQLSVSGVSTFSGITTNTSTLFTNQLSVSGVSTFSGITTNTSTLFTNQLSVSGVSTFSQVSETVVNNFNSTLSPSSGTLTIDTSLGTVVLGDLNASVTTWAFTNVPIVNGRAFTITVIIDGDTSQTYGDACNVNGTSISGGIKWVGGSAPTATNNFDFITFIIVIDNVGTVNVFGAANPNFS